MVWSVFILYVQRFFGLTFPALSESYSKRVSAIKKISLVTYDILITVLVLFLFFKLSNGGSNPRLFNLIIKQDKLTVLFRLGSFALAVQYIINKSIFFLKGTQIISTIHSLQIFGKPISVSNKIKIYLYVIIFCFFGVVSFLCLFNDLESMCQDFRSGNFEFIFHICGGLFFSISLTSIDTIIMFTSDLVVLQLNQLIILVNDNTKFNSICK